MTALVEALERQLGEHGELPEEVFFFVSRHAPLVCVDLLVQNDAGETLLTWRDDRIFGRGWHLPGGVIRFGETRAERVAAVAQLELGCTVQPDRDLLAVMEYHHARPRERSHQYALLVRCRATSPPDESRRCECVDTPKAGEWCWHRHAPPDLLEVHRVYAGLIDEPPSAASYGGRHVAVEIR
jgi:colanic acid biosynthesis protein WcaH